MNSLRRKVGRVVLVIPRDRLWGRFGQLYAGLVAYGISSSLLVLGRHGLVPWDVLHQGLARQTGIAIGTWSIFVGLCVLVLWIPLADRPGWGTISNAFVIGGSIDVVLRLAPSIHGEVLRWACCLSGIVLSGVATGLYIGAGLGPGPRDGLMTGIARRTGRSLRLVRTSLELAVLAIGWLLGGSVGVVTVIYMLSIGPLAHVFVPLLSRSIDAVPAEQAATS
ncbi:MAG TPA: hypothetical protein VG265_10095 [Gaiellaceae bacterium]|nr:hypothetical protein [Gaiellaceae bacterium]